MTADEAESVWIGGASSFLLVGSVAGSGYRVVVREHDAVTMASVDEFLYNLSALLPVGSAGYPSAGIPVQAQPDTLGKQS